MRTPKFERAPAPDIEENGTRLTRRSCQSIEGCPDYDTVFSSARQLWLHCCSMHDDAESTLATVLRAYAALGDQANAVFGEEDSEGSSADEEDSESVSTANVDHRGRWL